MKKLLSFFAAALLSVSMFADPNIVTPTISGETEFTDSVIVTMSCPSPDADIYYTVDGVTSPTCDCPNAPEYTHPIVIKETTTIKAAAYDGNDWSGIAEVTFTKVTAKYYIVGNMTNWEVNENYEMNPSLEAETEEYFYGLDLTTASQFKVVKVEGETQTWYPDGMGNNYGEHGEIERDGEYTIYFRPNMDGGEAWFYNCILATRHTEPERVVVGFLFPENGMPANGISMLGSFIDGTVELSYVEETGGYMHDHIMAVDEDKFYLRATDDVDNFLFAYVDGAWDMAEFTFDEEWEQDTWKGDPVKMIDLDLSDNSKYAWQKAIPEGLDEVQGDKAESRKVMIDGMLYIVRDGKMYNVLGTEIR